MRDLAFCAGLVTVSTQAPAKKTMNVVSTAHLDSQWNWTVQDTSIGNRQSTVGNQTAVSF